MLSFQFLIEMLEKLNAFDEKISSAMRIQPQEGLLFRIAAFFAHSGDSWIWCGILFIWWLFSNGETERILAYWGGSIAVTACFVFILKLLIARARPEGEWGDVYRKTDPYSFPSGHSVRAGLIVVLAFHTFSQPRIIVLFVIWAFLMIFSRVATGVHYFLDVLAGFILGLLVGWFWIALQPYFFTTFSYLFDKSSWFK